MPDDKMSDKIGKLKCPFCGAELVDEGAKIGNENMIFACGNLDCDFYGEKLYLKVWQALRDGKKAHEDLIGEKTTHNILQDYLKQYQIALDKILEIKESVEGCCAEIQQNLLPVPPLTSDEKRINAEVSAIDKYMSDIDKIITSITQ